MDWLNESHALAAAEVYGRLPGGLSCNKARRLTARERVGF